MRIVYGISLLFVLVQPLAVGAQALAPGKYTGTYSYTWVGKPMQDMVTLTIESVEGNQFQGVAWVGNKTCRVDTPVRGQLEGDTLKVTGKAVKENCGIRWEMKVEGGKLEGKTPAGNQIVLSK